MLEQKFEQALLIAAHACADPAVPNDTKLARLDAVRQVYRQAAATPAEAPRADKTEREGFYEKLWRDFVSLQRGDVQQICREAELYRRSQADTPTATPGAT